MFNFQLISIQFNSKSKSGCFYVCLTHYMSNKRHIFCRFHLLVIYQRKFMETLHYYIMFCMLQMYRVENIIRNNGRWKHIFHFICIFILEWKWNCGEK